MYSRLLVLCISFLCVCASAQTGASAGVVSQSSAATRAKGCSPVLTKPSAADTLLAQESILLEAVCCSREGGKLHDASDMELVGLSGKVKKVYSTDRVPLHVENILIPPAEYYSYDMTTLSHDSGFELSGLLGLPTLQRLSISIDYRDNLLKLSYDPKHDIVRF